MATPAQITANLLNAQKSTGPANTQNTRNNALRHGLTSKQLLVRGEDPAEFHALHNRLLDSYAPEGEAEAAYVAQLAEHEWRLARARRVETATLNMYIDRYLLETGDDVDLALAISFERHGKEIDRLRRYEHAIARAFDQIRERLAALIKVRHMIEAQQPLFETEEDVDEEIGFVSQTASDESLHCEIVAVHQDNEAAEFGAPSVHLHVSPSGFDEKPCCNL